MKFALFLDYYSTFHNFRVSIGQMFLIWMLFSITLGNYATSNERWEYSIASKFRWSIIEFNVFPMFLANVNRSKHLPHFWWKKLRQYTHWDLVETNVWHTTPSMKDKKFLLHYKMNCETFNNLVLEDTFVQSSCLNHVRSQLKIKKIVTIVIYQFVHGFSTLHMIDQFNVGASII